MLILAPKALFCACWVLINIYELLPMNISKYEQRALHVLAQGGSILHRFDERGRMIAVDFVNREGWRFDDNNLDVFGRLRHKRLIGNIGGAPYRITRKGLRTVWAQRDSRSLQQVRAWLEISSTMRRSCDGGKSCAISAMTDSFAPDTWRTISSLPASGTSGSTAP